MNALRGRWFDGRTSAAHEADLVLHNGGRLHLDRSGEVREYFLAQVRISERIGDMPRRIGFPDGSVCEIDDNDSLDAWLDALGAHSSEHRVFRLERYWHHALAALLLVALGSWAFIVWGVPVMASHVARVLPPSVDEAIGREGLDLLDRLFLEPTQLPETRQNELHAQFDTMIDDLEDGHGFRLELRRGADIGANALALPSGVIIVTDELVELAEDPDEISAVLAHEIGHVVHRHSLRMLLQSSATALLMVGLMGDVSSASTLAASIPTILVQAKHSRQFETQADDYAYDWLQRHGIGTHHFGAVLKRIQTQHGRTGDNYSYFDSHPRTEDRARE